MLTIHTGRASEKAIRAMGRVVATATGQSKNSPITFRAIMIRVTAALPYRVFIHWAGTDDYELCAITSGAQMAYRAMESEYTTIEWTAEN